MSDEIRLPSLRPPSTGELLRYGSPLFATLLLLERSSDELRRRYQAHQLRKVLAAATRHAGYRRRWAAAGVRLEDIRSLDDLPALPPLAREELRSLSEDVREEPALGYARTSGSTGRPLTLPLDRREASVGQALVLYGLLRSGARVTDRLAQLVVPGEPRRPRFAERLGLGRECRIDLREGPAPCIDQLAGFRPDVVYGYPSHLAQLARLLHEDGAARVHPRLVVTHGEVLTPATRALLGRGFTCPVRNTYGSVELNRIGFECREGRLHALPTTIVETEDTPATIGEASVLVTSLYHTTVPLLRYRLGDRIVTAHGGEPCGCGSRLPTLGEVVGRCDDVLLLPSGRSLSPRAVCLLEEVPGIAEYRIVQRRRNLLDVEVRLEAGAPLLEEEIRATLRRGLQGEPVEIRIHRRREIPRAPGGKLRSVVSEVA